MQSFKLSRVAMACACAVSGLIFASASLAGTVYGPVTDVNLQMSDRTTGGASRITSDAAGKSSLTVESMLGVEGYDLTIDNTATGGIALTTQPSGTVYVMSQQLTLIGSTALAGGGTVEVSGTGLLDVQGGIDLAEGAIVGNPYTMDLCSAVYLGGQGAIKTLDLNQSELTLTDKAGTLYGAVEVGQLAMTNTNVHLKGFKGSTPEESGYGSYLRVAGFGAASTVGSAPAVATGTVNVSGNAVLHLSKTHRDINAIRTMVGTATALSAKPGEKATLIVPVTGPVDLGEVTIGVGSLNQSVPNGTIVLGDDARLMVDWTDTSVSLTRSTNKTVDAVEADVVLWGWNGEDATLDWLNVDEETSVTVLGSDYRGKLSFAGKTLQITREYFADLPGLIARNMTKAVETMASNDPARNAPGYGFLADTYGAHDRVGLGMMANTVDGAAFLPTASGILLGIEQNHRQTQDVMLEHMRRPMDTESHWWVNAWGGKLTRDTLHTGGSGTWGVEADYAGVALGVDTRLKNGWTLSVAASGSTVDADTTGRIAATTSEATNAALSVAAAKRTDAGDWMVALTASQAQAESTQLTNAHRLHTEPEITMASLTGQWVGQYDRGVHIEPRLSLSFNWAKMTDGSIQDTDLMSTTSGVGFETEADDRVWGTVEAGLDCAHTYRWHSVSVSPRIGADVRYNAGDLDWTLRSRLPGTNVWDQTDWETTSGVSARVRLGLELMRRHDVPKMTGGVFGFGQEPVPGKTEPIDWRLSFDVSYERGEDDLSQTVLGLWYRKNF